MRRRTSRERRSTLTADPRCTDQAGGGSAAGRRSRFVDGPIVDRDFRAARRAEAVGFCRGQPCRTEPLGQLAAHSRTRSRHVLGTTGVAPQKSPAADCRSPRRDDESTATSPRVGGDGTRAACRPSIGSDDGGSSQMAGAAELKHGERASRPRDYAALWTRGSLGASGSPPGWRTPRVTDSRS
jgi:hypothetical protein